MPFCSIIVLFESLWRVITQTYHDKKSTCKECLQVPYSISGLLRMTTYGCERFMVDWAEAKIEED